MVVLTINNKFNNLAFDVLLLLLYLEQIGRTMSILPCFWCVFFSLYLFKSAAHPTIAISTPNLVQQKRICCTFLSLAMQSIHNRLTFFKHFSSGIEFETFRLCFRIPIPPRSFPFLLGRAKLQRAQRSATFFKDLLLPAPVLRPAGTTNNNTPRNRDADQSLWTPNGYRLDTESISLLNLQVYGGKGCTSMCNLHAHESQSNVSGK